MHAFAFPPRWTRRLAIGFTLLIVIIVASFGFVTTPAGGRWLQTHIENAVSTPDGISLRFEGLRLAFPLRFRADAMEIAQAGTPIAQIKHMTVVLLPGPLLRGQLCLSEASAARIVLLNRPVSPGDSNAGASRLPPLFIERLNIGELRLERGFAGMEMAVTVEGGISWTDFDKRFALRANRLDGSGTLVDADVRIGAAVQGKILVDDAAGLLPRLAGFNAPLSPLAADLTMEGTSRQWNLAANGRLGEARFSLAARGGENTAGMQSFTLNGEAETATLLPAAVRERIGSQFTASLTGVFSETQMQLSQLSLRARSISAAELTAQAAITSSPFSAAGDVQLRAEMLPKSLLPGIARIAVALSDLVWRDGQLQPNAHFALQFEAGAAIPPITAAGTLVSSTQETWALRDLTIENTTGTFSGEATYQSARQEAALTLRSLRIDGDALRSLSGIDIGGALSADLQASYRDGRLGVRTIAAIGRLGSAAASLENVKLTFEGRDLLGTGALALDADASLQKKPLSLSIDARRDGDDWSIRKLALNFPGIALGGSASLRANGVVRGALDLDASDVAPLASLFTGDVSGSLAAQIRLGEARGTQSIDVDGRLHEIAFGKTVRIGSGRLTATIQNATKHPVGITRVDLLDAMIGGEPLRTVRADLRLDGAQAALTLLTRAPEAQRFDLDATAALVFKKEETAATLNRFDGYVMRQRVSLAQPVHISMTPAALSLDAPGLRVGDGFATAAFAQRSERIDARLRLLRFRLPLSLLSEDWPRFATIDAEAALRGTLADPQGEMQLSIEANEKRETALRLTVSATLQNRLLQTDSRITADGASVAVQGTARLADGLQASSFTSPASRLDLSARGAGELSRLDSFLPIGEDRVQGRFSLAGSIGGTIAAPRFQGRLSLDGGRYENAVLGAVFSELQVRLDGDGEGLRLESVEAKDGDGGSVIAEGAWPFANQQGRTANVRFERFRLLRRDDVSATVSGALALSRGIDAPLLSGALVIDSAAVNLAETAAARAQTLEVIEIPAQGPLQRPRSVQPAAPPLQLDVKMGSRRPLFVRGRGLDSQWNGELAVTGSLNDPQLQGRFTVERGEYRLLGQRLPLTNGTVTMTGGGPRMARLEVTSRAVRADATLDVVLSGPILEPAISFSSTPPLPSEEILSRLLFGQTRASLGPLQAVQLADAARSLTGIGGSASLTERLRDVFGLATFDVGTDAQGNTQVRAGSYLRRGVYLGLQRSTGSGVGSATLEIDVKRNLTIDTTVGTSDERELGINWRRDY
jgi:translocation and assembly module TamB